MPRTINVPSCSSRTNWNHVCVLLQSFASIRLRPM
jgi:hypothetical protein